MMAVAAPGLLAEVARISAPPPGGFTLRRADWGAFRAEVPGTGEIAVLRPLADGLRIERRAFFETVPWDDVVGVVLTEVVVAAITVRVARVQFRRGPTLDLADVHSPGADALPPSLDVTGRPLLRIERMRMAVASIVAGSGLAPRSRDHFHRGGRGVPVPDLTALPVRMPGWVRFVMLPASVVVLPAIAPVLTLADSVAIHAAILLHEAGHAVAMLRTGTEVRSLLFLPAIGAALRTEHPFRSRWADAVVALCGPATGIPIALVAVVALDTPPPDPVQWFLVTSVVYNLVNLLPFAPLDGGRVFVAGIAGLPRAARTLLAWLPIGAALAWVLSEGLTQLTVLEFLLLAAAVVLTRMSVRRMDFHQWVFDSEIDPDALRAAVRDVSWGFGGAAREDTDGGAPPAPLRGGQVTRVIVAYGVLVALLAVATAAIVPLLPACSALFGGGDP